MASETTTATDNTLWISKSFFMKCKQCGNESQTITNKFFTDCGESLVKWCLKCDDNKQLIHSNFCSNCGESLIEIDDCFKNIPIIQRSKTVKEIVDEDDTVWGVLSKALSGNNYVSRAQTYYEFMAGVSGLLAGFTYITTSEEPSLTGVSRTIYGIVGLSGFVSALVATITSIILWVSLSILGPECYQFFGENFGRFHHYPAVFTVLSFIFMSISIIITVQG
eukprot:715604_1